MAVLVFVLFLHLLFYSLFNFFPQNPDACSADRGTVSFGVIGNIPKGFLGVVGNLDEVVIIGFV